MGFAIDIYWNQTLTGLVLKADMIYIEARFVWGVQCLWAQGEWSSSRGALELLGSSTTQGEIWWRL